MRLHKGTLDNESKFTDGLGAMTEKRIMADQKEKSRKPQAEGPVKRLYSIPEAAFYLGRTVDALREMIWAGKLQSVRDGKRILLDVRDMDAWIDRNKTQFTF